MKEGPRVVRRRVSLLVGVALLGAGLLFLAASGGYYLYGVKARSDLGSLVVAVPQSTPGEAGLPSQPGTPPGDGTTPRDIASPSPEAATPTPTPSVPGPGATPTQPTGEAPTPLPGNTSATSASDVIPGETLPTPQNESWVRGFSPVDPATAPAGGLPTPSRMVIPQIEVDSETRELDILDLGDSRAYETPDNAVGHIPDTANPGERGNGWYFGHLESPLKGEGSVFRDLPKIPELLCPNRPKNPQCLGGVPVYVVLQGGDKQYLYRVTRTDVVKGEELRLTDSEAPIITLVTCVPRFYYDHRLLVTAELVGVKTAP